VGQVVNGTVGAKHSAWRITSTLRARSHHRKITPERVHQGDSETPSVSKIAHSPLANGLDCLRKLVMLSALCDAHRRESDREKHRRRQKPTVMWSVY
jgi:hypothetical protein